MPKSHGDLAVNNSLMAFVSLSASANGEYMLTKAIIIAILMKLPVWKGDTEEENRQDRIEVIGESIYEASQKHPFMGSSDRMAYLLINQGWWETKFAKHVHEGNCRVEIGECDHGRAGSPWQIQYGHWFPKDEWEKLIGTDPEATTAAAMKAAQILNSSVNLCISRYGNNPAMHDFWATSAYGTSRDCTNKKSQERIPYLRKIQGIAQQIAAANKEVEKERPQEKEAKKEAPKATKES